MSVPVPSPKRRLRQTLLRAALIVFSVLLVAAALVIVSFFSWHSRLTSALNAGSQVIQTERGAVEYTLVGDENAPVVLSVHGVTGGYDFGVVIANNMLSLTESGFRVLSVSRPGYLQTPLGDHQTPAEQAELYAALLDELDISSVALLAVSGGGPSALAFAHQYPDRVWGMVMAITITRRWDHGSNVEMATSFMSLPPLVADGVMWFTDEVQFRFNQRDLVRQTVLDNTRLSDPALSALVDQIMNSPERLAHLHQSIRIASPMSVRWSGTLNDLEQMTLLPEAPDYSSIRAPIIAFYGELDTLVPLYHADYLVATVPGVELYVDPAGGHAPFLHNNWTFTQRRIVDFLQTHAPGFGG